MSQKEENEENPDDEIKVILLGDPGVGKTNLINIATGHKFSENEKTTTFSSYSVKKFKFNEKEYKINLWDTIGQEKLRPLTKIFYNNSKIVIFVYDITSEESFKSLPEWMEGVDEQIGSNYIKGLVANKSDLFINEKVSTDEGEEFANNIKAKFLLFSAKNDNPKKFEEYLIKLLEIYISKGKGENKRTFSIYKNMPEKDNKNNCCN